MKKFGTILLLLFFWVSCKDETTYQMQILIKNETNNILTIKLFPKSKYMSGGLYDFSEIGGGSRKTEFQLGIDSEIELYISGDLNKKPNSLATEVFDSIYVVPSGVNKTEIKFTPDTVIGYSENLYDDNSSWIYELRKFNLQTSLKRKPVESHDYIFTISED